MIKSATMLIRSEDDLGAAATRIFMPPSLEEEKKNEKRPLISRTLSYTDAPLAGVNSNAYHQKRRRRVSSDNSLLTLCPDPRQPFGKDVGRAAADTYLITRLSFKFGISVNRFEMKLLNKVFMVGYRWITRFLALGCYAFLLFPGFLQVGYSYFFSKQIRRGIVYGDQPRNRLDLYLPRNVEGPKPVVAFVTGGAWIIGYKAWGSLLGQQLSERDVIVACIDYRNFPQGTISDMVKDASQGISFVCNHIAEYGGDPNRIYLMGQSAGAHIAACALLDQAIKEAGGEKSTWSVSQIKAYFGLSGGYNFLNLIDHFHSRGLYRSIFLGKSFAETLRSLGVQAESVLYEGKTHTDLFLQDPMRGGKDDMFEDVVAIIHAGDPEARARDAAAPPRRRLVPEFMLKLARSVSPF
ncbi:Isoprenylcysteine alpha-carbonyl methylesterase ICME [Sesamum angolense]|uniref:protein-S-isoprenylcysteine alpha-carbonyl methylesterase n=1 Tax=Sesamum angolense TaxID=2727404 RepID=A0AAE1WUM3_9LAMI|nr:Isoprenylcysteine alpha-carbonyl methylesterase ICME [Sesamum angolense]